MGLRIATNTQSLMSQRTLGTNNQAQKASMEKLSSGTRISKAADDAAGLAISEKMRADIASIRQDVRNANDGISMIQTAEGGMNEVANILVRFRELSIQAASDTLTDVERGFINKEVSQLRGEVDRIAKSTEFNNKKLLSGVERPVEMAEMTEEEFQKTGFGVLEIQVGKNNDASMDRFQYDTRKSDVTVKALGLTDLNTATKTASQENLAKIDGAIQILSSNRADLGALQNRLQSTVNNLQIYNENLSDARSRIYDVDFASETAELTKRNILTSAGTSILSQANSNSMGALKLLS